MFAPMFSLENSLRRFGHSYRRSKAAKIWHLTSSGFETEHNFRYLKDAETYLKR